MVIMMMRPLGAGISASGLQEKAEKELESRAGFFFFFFFLIIIFIIIVDL